MKKNEGPGSGTRERLPWAILGVAMPHRVGLVEDDDVIRENLRDFLEDRGFSVSACRDRKSALEAFRAQLPDVAILDLALGDEREGGFRLCADLRQLSTSLSIIFLTSYDDEINRISGLRVGADDYLSKDRSFDFLVVRIETLIARQQALREERGDPRGVGSLQIDRRRCQVAWKGDRVDLPLTQYWMVAALVSADGAARSHQELMRAAQIHVAPNTIAAHIKSIRERFRAVDPAFDAIRTERGLGYRWVED